MQGLLNKVPVKARSGRPSLLALTWVGDLCVGGALHVMLCSLSFLSFLNGAILGFAVCLSCATIRASFLLHSSLFNMTCFIRPLQHMALHSLLSCFAYMMEDGRFWSCHRFLGYLPHLFSYPHRRNQWSLQCRNQWSLSPCLTSD